MFKCVVETRVFKRVDVQDFSFKEKMTRDYGFNPATSDSKWEEKFGKNIGLPKKYQVNRRVHTTTASFNLKSSIHSAYSAPSFFD